MNAPAGAVELSPAQQYEQALGRGGLRLAFGRTIEADYVRYQDERVIPLLRLGFIVGAFLYAAFFVVDLFGAGRMEHFWMFALAFGIGAPATAAPAAATLVRTWRPYARRIAPLAVALNGATIVGAVLLTAGEPQPLPYQVLILNVLYIFFLYGILFRLALPLALALVGTFLALEARYAHPGAAYADHAFILLALVLLCAMASYLFERVARRSWLREQLVSEMALRDGLTGLYNRRHLYEQSERILRQALHEQKALGVLMLDVDHFKRYNDSLGHLAGDECLRHVAGELRATARRPLDLAVRLGGEEFAIVLFDIGREQLLERAEDLRRRIEARGITHPDAPLGRVTLSVGAALSAQPGVSLDLLLAAADRALYAAKAEGRNCVRMAPA